MRSGHTRILLKCHGKMDIENKLVLVQKKVEIHTFFSRYFSMKCLKIALVSTCILALCIININNFFVPFSHELFEVLLYKMFREKFHIKDENLGRIIK